MPPKPREPLSADELAVVYLQGRDVPCPSCGYNRRDGTSPICPECGDQLSIIAETQGWRQNFIHFERRMLTMLMSLSLVFSLFYGYWGYRYLGYLLQGVSIKGLALNLTLYAAGSVGFCCILIACARRRGNAHERTRTPAQASFPLLIYTILAIGVALAIHLTNIF